MSVTPRFILHTNRLDVFTGLEAESRAYVVSSLPGNRAKLYYISKVGSAEHVHMIAEGSDTREFINKAKNEAQAICDRLYSCGWRITNVEDPPVRSKQAIGF